MRNRQPGFVLALTLPGHRQQSAWDWTLDKQMKHNTTSPCSRAEDHLAFDGESSHFYYSYLSVYLMMWDLFWNIYILLFVY
jgi:hypothetical protein